jgi:very-short-patch-repair endonuclease
MGLSRLTGGLLFKKVVSTNQARHGVDNAFQSKTLMDKARATWLAHYGVDHPQKSEAIQQKTRDTCMDRYGVENVGQADVVKERMKQTCLAVHGVEYSGQIPEARKKAQATMVDRYGAPFSYQSAVIMEKMEQTNLARRGVKNVMQDPAVSAKAQETRRTRLENGEYLGSALYKSAPEDEFAIVLRRTFGDDGVVRQKRVGRSSIDFYVKQHDVYLEIDGVFHHGLDEGSLVKYKRCRDKFKRDRVKDKQFADMGLTFLRVSDVMLKKLGDEEVIQLIVRAPKSRVTHVYGATCDLEALSRLC